MFECCHAFLDFNARSGRDATKTLMLDDFSDTSSCQTAFLDRLKSSCILAKQRSPSRQGESLFSPDGGQEITDPFRKDLKSRGFTLSEFAPGEPNPMLARVPQAMQASSRLTELF